MHVVLLGAVVAFVAHGRLHVAGTFSCSSWAIQKRFAAAAAVTAHRSILATTYRSKKTCEVFFALFSHSPHTLTHT